MTVVKCTKCNGIFVTARKVEEYDLLECPFCGEHGFYSESTDQKFKGEGYI